MHTSIDEQIAILMQGTEYGSQELRDAMERELRERLEEAQKAGRPLKVYLGVDPRTTDLHLGHTVPMQKLRQFQELGHDCTFLIGSFTSLIGDPSDKDKTRPQLTPEEVEANAQTYAKQAFKILDPAKTRIRYNADWLSPLSFADVINLASNFTVQQFLARENFANRLEAGQPIFLHEFFYALMQGYDAVAQETDVQIGGTDQLFNIVTAGRKLQQAFGQKPQIAIIVPILPGTDGKIKMSKSLGNHIAIELPPEDMYGKVMSLPDDVMIIYFKLVTRYGPAQIAEIEAGLESGRLHPRDAKMELAREIVSIFHGDEAAQDAEEHFKRVFQQRRLPAEIPEYRLVEPVKLVDLIAEAGLAPSKSQARRLIQQGGVRLDDERVTEIEAEVSPDGERILQVGKRRFLRLTCP
ncbi:MAG: tyrosine--tRNA ligase [Chloroflexi bacterium]|nr:MAG: tyrosine--tRNA ligase [Chloroflexota bacterium]